MVERTSVVHEVGVADLLCWSKAADPSTSEPSADNTEVGDSWLFPETEKCGDGDLSGDPMRESTDLRG